LEAMPPLETTGRNLIILDRRKSSALSAFKSIIGELADSRDFRSDVVTATHAGSEAILLSNIGIAIAAVDPEQGEALLAKEEILAIEPEGYCYALESAEFLRGFRAGVNAAVEMALTGQQSSDATTSATGAYDECLNTWGLQATRVDSSTYTGLGIRVAVLDTGIYLKHPDFLGRNITSEVFVNGADLDDASGHGTHCAGTICGPKWPSIPPRYGVAPSVELYVGKVLNDQGRGTDSEILAGIDWAIGKSCHVISMSLGAATKAGQPHLQAYEQAALAALESGTLIIAAAGNDSRRPQAISPLAKPANCPSIFAVAALDDRNGIARFSCGQDGGSKQPQLAGPGLQVRSAWLPPTHYNVISGTSMATPHVAGIAALCAEATGLRGADLWQHLEKSALKVNAPAADAGAGLVQSC